MRRSVLSLLVVFIFANCLLAEPAEVVIIRHAEKPDEGNELSLAGRERAAALLPYFLGTPAVLEFGRPVAIYAQSQKHASSSLRPIETVQPLADSLHLKINDTFERDDYKKMVAEIKHERKYDRHTVLICWEHKVIPEIAKEFDAEDAPQKWRGNAFDRTWVLKATKNGHQYKFQDLPQKLMFGDSKN
jgi:broad specificity phosphatase PhoE